MNRVEKYRSIKLYKRKCRRMILLFLFLTITGILIADYSINGLMTDENRVKIISVNTSDSQLELCFMNIRLYIEKIH